MLKLPQAAMFHQIVSSSRPSLLYQQIYMNAMLNSGNGSYFG